MVQSKNQSRAKTGATVSNKNHIQLQTSIWWRKKSETATTGVLLKEACNFIKKSLQYGGLQVL